MTTERYGGGWIGGFVRFAGHGEEVGGMAAERFWRGVRTAGQVVLRSVRAFFQDKNESFPITEEPYQTGDATDPHNALGRPPDDRRGT